MNSRLLLVAAGMALAAAPVFAQQPPPKPAPTTPPATPPAAAPQQPAAPAAQPPRPFPEGSKFAYVNVQRIAQESVEGKGATAKINALREKKELQDKNSQLDAARKKFESSQSVIADAARAQQQKDIERLQLDLQRATQDAQGEVEELQRDLQLEFQRRLLPLIEEVRAAKGLLLIFSSLDSGILAADTGLDITQDVIKRLDSAPAKK
jgi:outer membrane protein